MDELPPDPTSSARRVEPTQTTATTPPTNSRPTFLQRIDLLGAQNPIFETLGKWFRTEGEETRLEVRVLDIGENGEVRLHDDYATENLETWSHSIKTRLVVVPYAELSKVDFSILGDICSVYELDPYHIWRIFRNDDVWFDLFATLPEPPTDEYHGLKIDVLTDKAFFEMSFGRYNQDGLSAIIVNVSHLKECNIVILFCREVTSAWCHPMKPGMVYSDDRPTPQKSASSTFTLAEIQSWSTQQLKDATETPFDFVVPYCRLLLNQAMEKCERYRLSSINMMDPELQRHTRRDEASELFDEEVQDFEVWLLTEQLKEALEKLQDFTSANRITYTSSVRLLETILQMLVGRTRRLKDALKDQLSRRAAIMSLQESRKSIQLADSVRNLTQLAFVFIPLTFGASIFGSNLQEFGSGSVPAWKFCVSLVAVLIGTFCVTWLWSIRTAKVIPAYKRLCKKNEKCISLFLRSPRLALLLCLCMWTPGKHAKNRRNLPYNLGLGALNNGPRAIPSTRFQPAPSTKNFHERFWINCLYRIGQYTSQDEWWEDRFYKPWIRARRLAKLKEERSKSDDGV